MSIAMNIPDQSCCPYNQEEDCIRALFQAKWPHGFRCPRCDHPHFYLISTRRLPLYECLFCDKQTSLIVDTIFEGSKTSLLKWFQAVYLHARPEGISALQLSREIQVTYKTAWLICHKLRHAMSHAESEQLLSGTIHITNVIFYRRIFSNEDWHEQEQPVLIGASENNNREFINLKIKKQTKEDLLNRYDTPNAKPFIGQNVNTRKVDKLIFSPLINRKNIYLLANDPAALEKRRVERESKRALLSVVWKAQSWIAFTFRGVGSKHLQAYLDQFCYGQNRSNSSTRQFIDLLHFCAMTPVITYPVLTGRHSAKRSARPSRHAMISAHVAS